VTGIPETEWSRAVRLLQDADEIALACDVTADGDALGCLLAAAIALRKQGRRAVASWGRTPFEVPRALAGLPGQELLVPPARFPRAPGLLVTFAAPDVERLGQLAGAAERAEGVIVVDDHDSNTLFGNVHLVDPDIEATVVIVDDLLRRLGVPLDAALAAPLYAGLSSGTGSFRYRVTSAATHEFAARLLRTGFRHDLLARAMWDTHSVGYLRLLGVMLSRLVAEPEAAAGLGLVWTYCTAEEAVSNGVPWEEAGGPVADLLQTAEDAGIAAVCKKGTDGTVRVSLRSRDRIDVSEIAADLGGGGHRFAAGFTSYTDVPATMALVRDVLAPWKRRTPA